MWHKQSCIECGFLGWCEVKESFDGMFQGQAKSEITKQDRDGILKSSNAVQCWNSSPQDESGSILGCFRSQWSHLYSYDIKKREEVQKEVFLKRQCKHFINYEPSRKPDEHLLLLEKARDRRDHVKDIVYGAFAVAIATGLIEFIRWLFTKSN